mgnify:CR=1 FL=1
MVLLNIIAKRQTGLADDHEHRRKDLDGTNQFSVVLGEEYEAQQITLRKSVVTRHTGTWSHGPHIYVTMPAAILHSQTTLSNSWTKTPRLALPCTNLHTDSTHDISFYAHEIPRKFDIYFWKDDACTQPLLLTASTTGLSGENGVLKEVGLWFELSHTEKHS